MKGNRESEDQECEDGGTLTQDSKEEESRGLREEDKPSDQSAQHQSLSPPPSKRQKGEPDLTNRSIYPTRPTPLSSYVMSSHYAARSFQIDPRYGGPYVPDWVYCDTVNFHQCPLSLQQLYPTTGLIH